MSDLDILKEAIGELGMINIPAYLAEQVSIPVRNVRMKLMSLAAEIEKDINGNSKEEDPEVKVIPVEMAEEETEN